MGFQRRRERPDFSVEYAVREVAMCPIKAGLLRRANEVCQPWVVQGATEWMVPAQALLFNLVVFLGHPSLRLSQMLQHCHDRLLCMEFRSIQQGL
eukprot:11496739-Alexandrium_andersonii.AAC.1